MGTVGTKTTVFTIPPVTMTEIEFWPITIGPDDTNAVTITPQQSVMPPSTFINLLGTEASIQITESPAPTTTSESIIPLVFFTSSHAITFQKLTPLKVALYNGRKITPRDGPPSDEKARLVKYLDSADRYKKKNFKLCNL